MYLQGSIGLLAIPYRRTFTSVLIIPASREVDLVFRMPFYSLYFFLLKIVTVTRLILLLSIMPYLPSLEPYLTFVNTCHVHVLRLIMNNHTFKYGLLHV